MTALAPPQWQNMITTYRDTTGHEFHYILIEHPGCHQPGDPFQAFLGEWGDAKPYRATFQGYFHRLRMFADVAGHNWLFLCDEYGADKNGTYYTGEKGDFFVERATTEIIAAVMRRLDVPASQVVTIGSSMGATAALKLGLAGDVGGIVAIAPHIDLDVCAQKQDRMLHVSFVCPDGDPLNPANHRYTRQVREALRDRVEPPPPLFIQSCKDDGGVYREQVLSLCQEWGAKGGRVDLDARKHGGHTSDYATRPLLLEVVRRMLADAAIDVRSLQSSSDYAPP